MKKVAISAVAAILAAALITSVPAKASSVTYNYSGNLNGNAVFGSYTLDVSGGQALDGTGLFTGFGFNDVSMVLITPSTPGNEGGPVGFRANDGTDLFGADTAVPADANGLLFDVNTLTASFGIYPLLAIGSGNNNSIFTGNVGGTEYYAQIGTIGSTVTPIPAALPLFASGLAALGLAGYGRRRSKKKTGTGLALAAA